jgi:hypothetical protein
MTDTLSSHRFEDRTMGSVCPPNLRGSAASRRHRRADDAYLAEVYARTIFNEFTWIEMVLFPRESGVAVVRS